MCLQKYTPGHYCSDTYFHRKLQKNMQRGCRCGSKINAGVCPCDKQRPRGGAGGGAHQNPQPRHPGQGPGAQPPSGPGPAPATVTRSARVGFPSNFIRMNNTIVSFSLTICQEMYLVAPNGYKELYTVVFDNGSENSQISETLKMYSHGDTPATFCVKTIGHSYQRDSGFGKFQLQSPYYPERNWMIDCLYNNLNAVELTSRCVNIPQQWQSEYHIPPSVASPGGRGVIIIGSDLLAQCHPHIIDTAGSLVLLQSKLDNQYILGGCISETNIHNTDLHQVPKTPHSYVNRIAVRDSLVTERPCDNMIPPLIDDDAEELEGECWGKHRKHEGEMRDLHFSESIPPDGGVAGARSRPEPELIPWPGGQVEGARAGAGHGCHDGGERNDHSGGQTQAVLDPRGGPPHHQHGDTEGPGAGLGPGDIAAIKVNIADRDWIKIMGAEHGALLPIICKRCRDRSCADCEAMLNLSPITSYENQVLASCLSLNQENRWILHGKYNEKLRLVPDNFQATLEFQKRLEKRLLLNPTLMQSFNENIQRRIDSKMFVKLDDLVKIHGDHILNYKMVWSPTNFVQKLSSTSNKVRAVFNQSFKPDPQKPSLNDSRFKGSSYNKNIQHILLRSRSFFVYSIRDILDFYNQLSYQSIQDQLLNCFIHKDTGYGSNGDWVTIVSTVLNFGQRDAQNLANFAKISSSEKYVKPISEPAHEQTKWSLSDDFGVGGDNRGQVDDTIHIITPNLEKNGFRFKKWIHSFDKGQATVLGQKGTNTDSVLGVVWETEKDRYSIPININLSPKKRGLRSPEFEIKSESDMKEFLAKYKVNKRALARFCAQIFDPLLLLGHLRCVLTLLFHRAIRLTPGLKWDGEISPDLHEDILHCVRLMLECKGVTVPRFACEGIVGKNVEIVAVVDGSQILAATRVFVRYKTSDKTWDSNYLFGCIALNDDEISPRQNAK